MIDNTVRDYVFNVIQEKGFHDTAFSHLQSLTWRQICHLFIELGEFYQSDSPEELADVAIVFLDLLGLHGIDVPKVEPRLESAANAIAEMANLYRKQGVLVADRVWSCILGLAEHLDIDLYEAVMAKMKKNERRPKLYGLHKEGENDR